ncbi:MAG: helix-turn-helix transcriptional regulator [Bacilli bacterium]|nr:helix-turn-helix transcriptional regulator [Bacilli bacterium]
MYNTENLKKIRIQNNLTSAQVAHILNITPAYYSQIENKKRRLFYDMAVKISNIFDMKPDDIFYKKNT